MIDVIFSLFDLIHTFIFGVFDSPFTFALLCACPVAAEPGDVSKLTCIQNFGQLQKVIMQRTFSTGTTLNTIAIAASAAELQATWDALQNATDSTKVVWSNTIGDPTNAPGEAIVFGSGNQVPDGNPIVLGTNSTSFTSALYSYTQDIVVQMKAWRCEEVSFFLVNSKGQIGGLTDDHGTPTTFRGIPLVSQSMFIGDKQLGGQAEPDRNAFNWSFKPNWSDMFHVITPQFDALAGLYD